MIYATAAGWLVAVLVSAGGWLWHQAQLADLRVAVGQAETTLEVCQRLGKEAALNYANAQLVVLNTFNQELEADRARRANDEQDRIRAERREADRARAAAKKAQADLVSLQAELKSGPDCQRSARVGELLNAQTRTRHDLQADPDDPRTAHPTGFSPDDPGPAEDSPPNR